MMSDDAVRGLQQIRFRAMGSHILAAVQSEGRAARQMLDSVPTLFAEWEEILSRFKADSELNRLNNAGSAQVQVSPVLWEVLQWSLEAAAWTDGLVTLAVLNALEDAGYKRSFDERDALVVGLDNTPVIATRVATLAAPVPDWRLIETWAATRTVRLPEGMRIDFGGVGKGWAADKALALLAPFGPALVNAGGDIAVSAPFADGAGWAIGVDAPGVPLFAEDEQLELLIVGAGGVATSATDYRRWQQDGQLRHHIIDPRSGAPAQTDVLAATVVGPSASTAEVAAKKILLLGSESGLRWLEDAPDFAALIVLHNGQIVRSNRLDKYIWKDTNGN